MATNADTVVDDDKPVTEDDLRNLKYGDEGVETTPVVDEPEEPIEEAETPEETEPEDEIGKTEEPEGFVKEFPNIKGDTPEEYAKNLEIAYQNSTAEFQRLRAEALKNLPDKTDEPAETPAPTTSSTLELYAKQQLDRDIEAAFADISKRYEQVNDQTEYNKFTTTVAQLSQTILNSEKRLAPPAELYQKAAVILNWESTSPTSQDKLGAALKDGAAVSKTPSVTKRTPQSKVTDEMIAVNRKMYPGKSDQEIREELEPFVN